MVTSVIFPWLLRQPWIQARLIHKKLCIFTVRARKQSMNRRHRDKALRVKVKVRFKNLLHRQHLDTHQMLPFCMHLQLWRRTCGSYHQHNMLSPRKGVKMSFNWMNLVDHIKLCQYMPLPHPRNEIMFPWSWSSVFLKPVKFQKEISIGRK